MEKTPGSGGEIVVVGAINVDLVAPVPRLPRPGETVVGARLERHGGGKGANAAVAAARAGARVRMIGAVGDDDLGEGALAELRDEGITVDDVAVVEGQSTGVALIVVDEAGENQIAVAAGANGSVDPGRVGGVIEGAGVRALGVVVSTEINGSAVIAAVESASRLGLPCVLNPAPVVPEIADLLGHGPVLTPNATECAALAAMVDTATGAKEATGATGATGATAALARSIATRSGAPVVVTLGAGGALVVEAGGDAELVATRSVTVVDTTGAGDTFNGVLGARLGAGDALMAAVRAATDAATESVCFAGARRGGPATRR